MNILTPGRCNSNTKRVISELRLRIKFISTSWKIAHRKINIGSGDDLVQSDNKPLLELMLTEICGII